MNARSDRGYRADLYASVPMNGLLTALDRERGGIAWQKVINHQFLVLDGFRHLPVLLFQARRTDSLDPEIRAQRVDVELLDKWTGGQLLSESRYVSPGSFRAIEFDLKTRTIDLDAYREQLRIQPAVRQPE